MTFKQLFTLAAIASAACAAHADSFTLRMGGGHTTGLTYVGVYDSYFATEVSKRVKEKTGHDVRFIKAWGGSVAKVDGVIEAVQKGTLDIGLSPIGFEQSRAGLLNYSAYMPFTSPDPVLQQKVSNRMMKEVPALQASMKPYNSHVLGAMTSEAYGVTSKFDWNSIAELKGKRIALAGTNAPLFIAVGAVPVTLGIGEHYQAMQNSLADGSLFYASGLEAFKLQEVAKFFNKTGQGRDVNRHNYTPEEIEVALQQPVTQAILGLARLRKLPVFEGDYTWAVTGGDELRIDWVNGTDSLSLEFSTKVGAPSFVVTVSDAAGSRSYNSIEELGSAK